MASKARYQVAQATQVHHEGTTYDAGAALPADIPEDLIEFWLNAEWIEPS
jgi:hypothetical protein